jgi:hypothetical protein
LSELESYIEKEFPKPYQDENWKKEVPRILPERVYKVDSVTTNLHEYQSQAQEAHYSMLQYPDDNYKIQ